MRGRLRERELDTDRESFEATVTRFSKFSWTERYPKKIICVWPEDILARRKRFVCGRVDLLCPRCVAARHRHTKR